MCSMTSLPLFQHRDPLDILQYSQAFPAYVTPFRSAPSCDVDPCFLSWFLGFSEAEGCFKIWRGSGTTRPRMFFSLSQREEAICLFIQRELGFGHVSRDSPLSPVFRFQCSSKKDIMRLIHLFQGNLLLKKTTRRFHQWVECFHSLHGTTVPLLSRHGLGLPCDSEAGVGLPLPGSAFDHEICVHHSVLWTSGWLAGFLDGEGCFSASPTVSPSTSRCRFRGSVSVTQKGEPELLMHLAVLLDGGSLVTHPSSDDTWTYKTSGLGPLAKLHDYLTRFPLRTRKRWSYGIWSLIKTRIEKVGGHLQPREVHRVRMLARLINSHSSSPPPHLPRVGN